MKSFLRFFLYPFALVLVLSTTAGADVLVKYFELYEGRLAFSYEQKGKTKVYILDFATLEAKPLLKDDLNSEDPAWSPDGSKIAFQSNRSGRYEIYTADPDGSNVSQITKGGGDNTEPSWSPDGKWIVFQRQVSKAQSNIFVIGSEGQNLTEITKSTKQNISPRFKPNSNNILYVSAEYWPGWDLLEIDPKTKKIAVLTSGYNSYIEPAFDRSGNYLAYTLEAGPAREIWVEQKGNRPLAAVSGSGYCGGAEWMNDEGRMFFMGLPETTEPTDSKQPKKPEVFLLSTRTRSDVQITESQGKISHLSWNPVSPLKSKGFSGEGAGGPPPVSPMPLEESAAEVEPGAEGSTGITGTDTAAAPAVSDIPATSSTVK